MVQLVRRPIRSVTAGKRNVQSTQRKRDSSIAATEHLEAASQACWKLSPGTKPTNLTACEEAGPHTYLVSNNLSLVTQRGRWQNWATARIYVNEAAAELGRIHLLPAAKQRLGQHVSTLRAQLV